MHSGTLLVAIVALMDVATASGPVSVYTIGEPMFGTCRLRGISASSANFEMYASVPNEDTTLNEACGRCITVSRTDDPSRTTSVYVLNVCDGCASGSLQISARAMEALGIATTDTTTSVSYAFDACPTSLMSGPIEACLMEGGSSTYIPLQIYNSQKVIQAVTIDGVSATTMPASFLYSANPGSPSSSWYQSVDFSVTSDDGETLNGNFAFENTSGCATSDVQFYSASTGVNGNSGSSSAGAIVGGVLGGIVALLLIFGLVVLIMRRKRAMKNLNDPENDVENQYLSPACKPKAVSDGAFRSDHNDRQAPPTPTSNYVESFSPAAKVKAPGSKIGDMGSIKSPPVDAAVIPAAAVAASVTVDSLDPSNHLLATSTLDPRGSLVKRSPSTKPINVIPTYSFSNNANTSPHSSTVPNVKDAPTLTAPVVPFKSAHTGFYDNDAEEERSSFDIDDMRESEARGTSTGRMSTQPLFDPYMATDSYATTVTSPQSNVHATSLRRPSSKHNVLRLSGRESGQQNNGLAISNADSYASTAPRQTNESVASTGTGLQASRSNIVPASHDYSFSMPSGRSLNSRPTMDSPLRDSDASYAGQENTDVSALQHGSGSTRESGGYSRDSLSILGYPYTKNSKRHVNLTG